MLPLAAEKVIYDDLSLELLLLLLQLLVHVLQDVLDVSLGDEADLPHLLLLLGGQLPLLQDGQDCLNVIKNVLSDFFLLLEEAKNNKYIFIVPMKLVLKLEVHTYIYP